MKSGSGAITQPRQVSCGTVAVSLISKNSTASRP
jgi:hypothetical protein